ncbi:MAG: flagellar biosynthetic protein FliR [Sulfurospirillum sp.]|nr:flagellar biosynthetic protein FliR [Sulfurospirillum sp.]
MESLVAFFGEDRVISFFSSFCKAQWFICFFPFFSHANIPLSIKTSITFFMVVFLFPLLPALHVTPTFLNLTLAIVSEILIGLIAGLFFNDCTFYFANGRHANVFCYGLYYGKCG